LGNGDVGVCGKCLGGVEVEDKTKKANFLTKKLSIFFCFFLI
jgi:hypothetical protein